MNKFASFMKDESGATAIEYALLAGLIGVAIIGAVTTLGGSIRTLFTSLSGTLTGAIPSS